MGLVDPVSLTVGAVGGLLSTIFGAGAATDVAHERAVADVTLSREATRRAEIQRDISRSERHGALEQTKESRKTLTVLMLTGGVLIAIILGAKMLMRGGDVKS